MNFEFSSDQMLLRDQARKFLENEESVKKAREVLEGDQTHDESLWRSVVEMGWTATTIPEEFDGLGLGYLELCVIAEELGRSLAPTPFSSSVYLATEALINQGSKEQHQKYLPKLAAGEIVGTLAHTETTNSPSPENLNCELSNNKLNGIKIAVTDGDVANFAVVSAKEGDKVVLGLVDLASKGVEITSQNTLDPSRSHASIKFKDADAEILGSSQDGWVALQEILDHAAVLFAFEQLGGAEACMDMAKEYAMGRFAFGRPIASFQAIKHKIADMYIAVELARSNCYFGAWALSTNAPELATAAATARVSASKAFHECSKENIQTHGGMGFTWEFDCHLYYRRCRQLAANIGSQAVWKNKLISSLERANQI
ncbi:MAG TPA: acyl-CoA dehydrogenase [Gammaproteobacteria bacterium]|jgi:alkylation response protein AidB-like acyl-CoA dehydrogenase|nr:acyl-CoA dehydrogenase [Gammaproteobacteria bacterium]HIA43886.1 acyl-CoA dehydrogenase [Gammaproteobacteria bacterium]HIA96552.1 acyl-CoA dehydrogenase [Gammaproteobacteria bacterium]HIB75920.1 acyl-CoA dehydrogenase [Gammaproteobacteria bacterium]HIG50482.1 acyl-CoA dehydrogenase [Gammaproteobacteria bacterium]|tara:strand:+ start:360 stop:1472 length:1113 start_codon:yes stop_codon:yes gene_type:complete